MAVLANRGLLTLTGGIASGVLAFLAVVVVMRGLGPSRTGAFFEGISLFSIGTNVLLLGADVGLMRFVSLDRATSRGAARDVLRVGLIPIVGVSVLAAVVGYLTVPWLARLLSHGTATGLTTYLRGLVVALPIAVVYQASVSTSRAFGTVKTYVLIDKLLRPFLQVVLLLVVVTIGLGGLALAGAWVVPIFVCLVASGWWLRRRVRGEPVAPVRPHPLPLASRFWRFAAPRGLAATFQVLILWLDTLIIGFLRPPSDVAVYTASTRTVLLVTFVGNAITQAVAPQFGDLLARREMGRAEVVFRAATVWDLVVTWPLLIVLTIFAPVILGLFGQTYESGTDATRILVVSVLIGTGVGPIDWVLLMGGKSSWNLMNTAAALALNVVLNILLIPRFGIAGAAIAWGASIVVNSVAPLAEVMTFLRIDPFGVAHRVVSTASIACFSVPGLIAVAVLGQTLAALVISTVVAIGVYVAVLSRFADTIQLPALLEALKVRLRTAERPIDGQAA